MLEDVVYKPGTQKAPQQTSLTGLAFTDTDHVHFPDGRLTTLPPYSESAGNIGSVSPIGIPRSQWAAKLTGTHVGTYYLWGTAARLYVRFNNVDYNITPLATATTGLGSNPITTRYDDVQSTPLTTASGSNIVRVSSFIGDEVRPGDVVTISGIVGTAGLLNGIPVAELNATHTVLEVPSTYFTIRVSTAATSSGSPTESGSVIAMKALKITEAAHGRSAGDRIKIAGATGPIGGIPASEMNKEHIISVIETANTYIVPCSTAPTSLASGGGAGVTIQSQIAAGNIDQGVAVGYGTGEAGEGLYGQGGPAVTAQTFPRIWSFGNFGNEIVMCPGDYSTGDGQKIYIWDGDLSVAPTVLTNAPTDCNWILVVNNAIVALCGRRVDICKIGDGTVWSSAGFTYSKTLERIWKLIGGIIFGEKEAVLGTPTDAIGLRYVGGADLWELYDLSTDDGFLSPLSACSIGSAIVWRGARGCYSYDGSPVKKIDNFQNEEWITINTNYGKAWKSFAMADVQNSQWYHYFPAGEDTEPGNYAIHNINGHVTLGEMARTSAQRPGFVDSTFLMANGTAAAVAGTIYRHFTSGAVTFDWYAKSALTYIDGGEGRYQVDQYIPDSNQDGTINLQVITKDYAQGEEFMTTAYSIAAGTKWQSVKAAGVLFGFKLSGSAAATMGAWKLNLKKLGKR